MLGRRTVHSDFSILHRLRFGTRPACLLADHACYPYLEADLSYVIDTTVGPAGPASRVAVLVLVGVRYCSNFSPPPRCSELCEDQSRREPGGWIVLSAKTPSLRCCVPLLR